MKLPLRTFRRSAGEVERRHPTTADLPEHEDYPTLSGVRVLVVDDEADSNEVVGTLLGSRGADVRGAGSAAQTLAVLGSWSPPVIVTDVGMPDQDGYALLARGRARAFR